MRKRFFALTVIAIIVVGLAFEGYEFSVQAQSGTNEGGIINSDTTWTKSGSPYTLTGPVAVNRGVTLTVEAGVTVNLNGHYLQINGTLIAEGTSLSPIYFRGGPINFMPDSPSWDEQSGLGSIIEYANFSNFANDFRSDTQLTVIGTSPKIANNSNATISIRDGSPIIYQNTGVNVIILNGSSQITFNNIGFISMSGASPIIAFNNISGGISLNSNYDAQKLSGSPEIINNNITFTPISDGSVAGGTVLILSSNANALPVVSNNNITGLVQPIGQDQFGRRIGGASTSYGIEIEGNAVISNNVISGAVLAGISVGTPNFAGTPKITIENNTITLKGITISALVSATINYNNIQGGVSLSQRAANNLNATYNWWGTTDSQAINQTIYDYKDDFNLGNVSYVPFLTAPNLQAIPNPNAALPTPKPSPSIPECPIITLVILLMVFLIVTTVCKRTHFGQPFHKF